MYSKTIGWNLDNSYSNLPGALFTKISPATVKSPRLTIFNYSLAKEIGLNFSEVNEKELASVFSGNKLPDGSKTIAQAYAGHQFGQFTLLGDGRALIFGEQISQNQKRYDIQFKGSGKTPYSRGADGKAALGPMLREYIISECMNILKIPSTRSLAVVETGEDIVREKNLKGAILTRVASSHIRVGTFQFALISKEKNNLKALFNYTIERHYPHLKKHKSPALELLKIVSDKQIDLICNWMRVGFIHGVMNTDNMTVSGETIDYGPCGFMDTYDPATVFSSIDKFGRYAYFNQPRIAKWNLERFAETLLPLINDNSEKAVKLATEVLAEFPEKYKKSWINMMKKKLGIFNENSEDETLIIELLTWMHKNKADYTNTFCHLMNELQIEDDVYSQKSFIAWKNKWNTRVKLNNNLMEDSYKIMKEENPLVIPRNQIVENALKDASEKNDLSTTRKLLKVLEKPREYFDELKQFQKPSKINEKYVTYCGT